MRHLGNDRLVTSYDARTMLKAYRATPPLGEAESPEVALEHLLRIRANVLEEKLAMTEIDVGGSQAPEWLLVRVYFTEADVFSPC